MSSLRARLLLPIGIGLASLLVVGGWLVHRAVRATLLSSIDAALVDDADGWGDRLELRADRELESLGAALSTDAGGAPSDPEARRRLLELARTGVSVRLRPGVSPRDGQFDVMTADGRVLARSPELNGDLAARVDVAGGGPVAVDLSGGRRGRALLRTVAQVGFADEGRQREWERILGETEIEQHAARILVARDIAEATSFLQTLATVLWGLLVVLLLSSLGLVAWSVRRGLAPLDALRRQIGALDATTLDQRVTLEACPTELEPLVDALNDRLERLEAAFERERRTTAHIAHELRTPIAEIQSLAEVALTIPDDSKLAADSLADCRDAAHQMGRIVDAVLRLARHDRGGSEVSSERIDVPALLARVERGLADAASRRGQAVQHDAPPDLVAVADPEALETLLSNLLENAIRHAPEGSAIRVGARREEGGVRVRIENPCPDLDAADLPLLTEPYWRKDEARSGSATGGLGLALAAALARAAGLGLEIDLEAGIFSARVEIPA